MAKRYDQAVFRATHNSYSGHHRGDRRSLVEQLDDGVRGLELDIHVDDHRRHGYRVGHGAPGTEVERGHGNPDDLALASWLDLIAGWSSRHPGHAPLTLYLDVKDDLTHRADYSEGNLGALNDVLAGSLGDRLFTAETLGSAAWPALSRLRDRIVVVLSGKRGGRLGYLRDGGLDPAVAMDRQGRVVELHASRRGHVWYWSGQRSGDELEWRRHGRLGAGRTPAVAIAEGGVVIGVHARGDPSLEYRLGRLDAATLEVDWDRARQVRVTEPAPEPRPRIRVHDRTQVRLIYTSHSGVRVRPGRLRRGTIEWGETEPATPADARHQKAHARQDDRFVTVVSAPLAQTDGELLLYGTEALAAARIRYLQLAFVEAQRGSFEKDTEPEVPMDELRFFATSADRGPNLTWAKGWSSRGKIVRLWDYDDPRFTAGFTANFAATNLPFTNWYDTYSRDSGAVE